MTKAAVAWMMAAAAFVVFPAASAEASFSATAAGTGRLASDSIPRAAAPLAVANSRDVTVTWAATTLSQGTPATAYIVRRYDTSGTVQTVLADCTSVTTNTCVERAVPFGTWKYSVQARIGNWAGIESTQGAALTVSPASFALDSTAPITTLPANVTGTITGFASGEALTFRLDSVSGTVLSGTPSGVSGTSPTPVSVTVPAGTPDSPHSIFVVGSGGTVASATISIVIPPKLQSMQMRDIDGNGKVDQVTVVFDDVLGSYTAGTGPWTLANVPSGGSLSAVGISGSTATLTIAEGPGAENTAVGGFTVALMANSGGVKDVNGHLAAFTATAPTDLAPPAVLTPTMRDVNANGKIDQVTMTFSEALAAYSASTSVWQLNNVPSGGTLASVTVTTPSVTLAITEGAGAPDTGVGAFVIGLTPNAAGIRDAASNLATFSKAPLDGAKPIRQSQEMFDDNADGKIDRVLVAFSEPLEPFAAPVTTFSLSAAPSGATINTIGVTGSNATLSLVQGTGAATTAVGSFTVALTSHAQGIRDAAGNIASYTAAAPTDRAAPALITLSLLDNNGNGKVDRVTALFSETLSTYTAATAPWTLANTPSGGTLASVALSSRTLTLTLTEGAGAADTTVGSMKVTMAANAAGARDAGGNLAAFVDRTPLDAAKPAAILITDTNGAADGKIEPGDTVSITFSEPLAPASVPTSTTVTMTDPVGTGNDTLAMLGVSNGNRTLGANTYIVPDGVSATFADSPVALGNSNRTITVTVGTTCSGTGCTGIGQRTTNASYSFIAATTLTDVAGNLPATAAKTQSMRMF